MDAVWPVSFLLLNHETDSSLDVILGYFMTSPMSHNCALWSNFGWPATPGKVHPCYKFSPFVDDGSDCDSLEFQSLRNGFLTLFV